MYMYICMYMYIYVCKKIYIYYGVFYLCMISAKDLLRHRQKIIKLADQSEHGW